MTAEAQMWTKLAEHFPPTEVKQRPGAAKWEHKPNCEGARCRQAKDADAHHQFSYVDARAVMQRLDDVVTPAGWEFTSTVIPGTDIVHGRLTVAGFVREDYGYPNSEKDEEPIKAASSDALKRCAVMFGIGRHLYQDNTASGGRSTPPVRPPTRPQVIQRTDPDLDVHEARQKAAVLSGYSVPEEPEDLFPPIGNPANAVAPSHCPIHDVPWAGQAGDYWHKDPEGKYCRHPDNIKRPRRAS
jgi:hypothetical protein